MLRLATAAAFAATAALAAPAEVDPRERGVLRANPVTGLCDTVKQEAGYFNIDPTTDKNYFYWFFESRGSPSTDPLVLWLTGGPGCSSMLALLMENGPCSVKADGSGTTLNPWSWNTGANIIYLDQPAGAGFSYSKTAGYDHNQTQVSADVYRFLQAFLAAHPELQGRPFFVTGESYGGHYVPSVSWEIFSNNAALPAGDVKIPLAGFAVGNGMTSPPIQFGYYAEMAYNFSAEWIGHPTIAESDYAQMTADIPTCVKKATKCQADVSACVDAYSYCTSTQFSAYEATGLDVYDINITCAVPPLCTDMSGITTFLNTPAVKTALGVPSSVTWAPCNDEVNSLFGADWMRRFDTNIPTMLAGGVRVLIYAGDLDFICNWLGNNAWTLALQWPGQAGFNNATFAPWPPGAGADPAGWVRSYDNLTFLRVARAGHMVPSDQPEAAFNLLNTFLADKSWY